MSLLQSPGAHRITDTMLEETDPDNFDPDEEPRGQYRPIVIS